MVTETKHKVKTNRSKARNQHYVPRCLMSAFATTGRGKKPQVHVFDKRTDRSFVTATENIFSQRDFNTFEGLDGTVLCLEDGFAAIEDLASPVLRKLVRERSLASLSEAERMALIVFVALQKIRGVAFRIQMNDMMKQFRQRIREDGTDPNTIEQLREDGDENLKLASLEFVREHLQEFAQHYVNKALILREAPEEEEFLLGDAAVVWANQRDTGPYGNLGLSVLGIEIYMPISPNLALAFWCPSIVEMIAMTRDHAQHQVKQSATISLFGVGKDADLARQELPRLQAILAKTQANLHNIEHGTPMRGDVENMRYANSLQIAQSEQFIVSSSGDFSFVKEMLSDDAAYRHGHRFNIR